MFLLCSGLSSVCGFYAGYFFKHKSVLTQVVGTTQKNKEVFLDRSLIYGDRSGNPRDLCKQIDWLTELVIEAQEVDPVRYSLQVDDQGQVWWDNHLLTYKLRKTAKP
jgi:hypothetical protein